MSRFVRRAQETGKELSCDRDAGGARLLRAEARGRRRRLPHQRARRVRRRPSQGRLPGRRRRRVGQAVHAHVRRGRQRRLHRDPGLVHGRLRPGRRGRVRGRGEDVLLPAAPAGRVPHDLRQHPRAAARAEPAVDLRARDAALHAGVRPRQARHRTGGRQEQAQRGRPPRRAPGSGRHHGGRRPRQRDARLAGPAPGRLPHLRRCGRDRDGVRGRRAEAHRPPRLGAGRRVEPRQHLLDESRSRLPGVRRERGADGLRDGRRERTPQGDPRRRAVRPVRLQGAPPSRGAPALRPREGARGGRGRRHGPGRGSPLLPLRRAARGREPDRGGRPDEDRGALLAAPGRGRRPAGPGHARARRRAGVGRPDAGRDRRRDGERWRAAHDGHAVAAAGVTPLHRGPPRSPTRSSARPPGAVEQRLDTLYDWDAGEAIGAFLEGLREQRILATTCTSCGRTLVPPRKFCERCFRPTDGWTEVPQTGTVETFSICHVTWDMQPLEDAADPGRDPAGRHERGRLPAPLGRGGARRRPRGDGRSRPSGSRAGERAGSILDILYFRPLDPRAPPRARRGRRAPKSRWGRPHEPDEDPRRALGLVPLHARRGEHRVLRSAARSRGVPRLPLRRLRRDVPARADLLRALPRRARAGRRVRPRGRADLVDRGPRGRRRPSARSSRSSTGWSGWTGPTPSSSIA